MEVNLLLELTSRSDLRKWLEDNHSTERSCWVVTSRSKVPAYPCIPYLEIVEEALCFGWIDSTLKKLPDRRLAQRLSPRRKGSHWTELNKSRCIDLEDRGLMTEDGRRAFEKAYQYEIVSKGSPIEEEILKHDREMRQDMYKQDYSLLKEVNFANHFNRLVKMGYGTVNYPLTKIQESSDLQEAATIRNTWIVQVEEDY